MSQRLRRSCCTSCIERLRSGVREMENRPAVRLGSLMVVLTGVILAAPRYWSPH
jgi:hypothetical protein